MIEIKLGGKIFQSAPLNMVEYKRTITLLTNGQRDGLAGDMPAVVACYDALTEIICITVCRAGSQVTTQEISKLASPWEIVRAAGDLMKLSSMSDTPVIGKPN